MLSLLQELFLAILHKKNGIKYSSPVNSYLVGIGIAESEITPLKRGRIKLNGARWFARSTNGLIIQRGQKVNVVGRESQTLLIELSEYA